MNIMKISITKILFSSYFYLPIIYICVATIIYKVLGKIINNISTIKGKNIDLKKQKTIKALFKNTLKYVIIVLTLSMILSVYNINTTSIIASLSVVGVVVGLAFQDTLKNLLAGISIIFDNHYAIGDIITVNDFKGEVVSLGLQTTKIMSYTGEVFIINNSSIDSVINHSINDSKLIIDIPISYDVNLKKIDDVFNKLVEKINTIKDVTRDVEILGIDSFDSSAILYRISVDCKANCQFAIKRTILRMIKECFDQNKIEIPYNQLVITMNKGD